MHFQIPTLLTTSAGKPVNIDETFTLNSELLTNPFFIDTLKHSVQEKIPERVVHAKGTGAFGYLKVTNDVTKYCKAKLFEKVGKITPLAARFSTSLQSLGGNDMTRDLKGFTIKFYTEEGNFDLLNLQIPVYIYRDPILFGSAVRALKRNPKSNLRDLQAAVDFVTLQPNSLHGLLRLASPVGLPKTYRQMDAFPIHTFELNNAHGDSYFVRFKLLSNQGVVGLTDQEAALIGGQDPDFHTRDLYNAIERKEYPSWTFEMDVMTLEKIKKAHFEPFDVTRTWPNGTYKTVPIGQIVINKNVDNHFAQVEQAAYNPANLVPGIPGPPDQLFKGRALAYADTQVHRLGINRNRIEINCPLSQRHTYNRDGHPPVLDNMKEAPVYYPNSFHGPEATVDGGAHRLRLVERNSVNLVPAAEFFHHELNEEDREFVVNNVAGAVVRVLPPIRERFLKLLLDTDTVLGERVIRRAQEIMAKDEDPERSHE